MIKSFLEKTLIRFYKDPDCTMHTVSTQYPLPTDGDALYAKDVWIAESDIGDFSGSITDILDNLHSVISDTTANNPKELLIHFNRTVVSNAVGLGAFTGSFSNTEIQIGNSGGVFTAVIDESADATAYTSRTFQFPVTAGFNAIKLRFHTANTISLSNFVLLKAISVVARVQATKPDNTVTDINATAGGNLKISLEELESGISSNSNSQLNITGFGSTGVEYKQDTTTGALAVIDYAHRELHAGDHFYIKDWTDIAGSSTVDFLVITPNTTEWSHMVVNFGFEAEANITIYEGTTVSANGTGVSALNRNRNSAHTATLSVYTGPTVTAVGTPIARYKAGSGKSTGGEIRANAEIILEQNQTYLIRVTNDTVTANWCDYLADWYEHTNS